MGRGKDNASSGNRRNASLRRGGASATTVQQPHRETRGDGTEVECYLHPESGNLHRPVKDGPAFVVHFPDGSRGVEYHEEGILKKLEYYDEHDELHRPLGGGPAR